MTADRASSLRVEAASPAALVLMKCLRFMAFQESDSMQAGLKDSECLPWGSLRRVFLNQVGHLSMTESTQEERFANASLRR